MKLPPISPSKTPIQLISLTLSACSEARPHSGLPHDAGSFRSFAPTRYTVITYKLLMPNMDMSTNDILHDGILTEGVTLSDRPWATLGIQAPANAKAMFAASVTTVIGNGQSTYFWTDRWIHGKSIMEIAPALMPFVKKRGWKKRTVRDALDDNRWRDDFGGGLPVLAVWQCLQLWDILQGVTLSPDQSDTHIWIPESSGKFTTRSAYMRFFLGSTVFEPHKRLWRSWAPLKVKIFLWLAILNRCWTADRLARRGLQHPETCPLCDQEEENIQHILTTCVVAREVWFRAMSKVGLQSVMPRHNERSFRSWWRHALKRVPGQMKRGFNTLVMLVSWEIWKQRNRCVFDGARLDPLAILRHIEQEAVAWKRAGAKRLADMLP
ncbi:hypothetical protein EJB05_24623, partial [Eragrostis curvula]